MRDHEQYAPYRPPLTEEQKDLIRRAENPREAYGRIALNEAKQQLSVAMNSSDGKNAMPEDAEVCFRFPSVDPMGQYSIIEMKVSRRMQNIEAALQLRDGAVGTLVSEILTHAAVRERWKQLRQMSQKHRLYTRAEKLCWDEAAAASLHVSARRLEVDPVVAEIDVMLQGLEHLLGLRESRPSQEVEDFYRDTLGVSFTDEQYELGRRVTQPDTVNVLFRDFDNKVLQVLFSMPENWGLSMEELEELAAES